MLLPLINVSLFRGNKVRETWDSCMKISLVRDNPSKPHVRYVLLQSLNNFFITYLKNFAKNLQERINNKSDFIHDQ